MNTHKEIKGTTLPAIVAALLFLSNGADVPAQSPPVIMVGAFSTEETIDTLPAHWEPLHFREIERHTSYRLVEENGNVVVKASADSSASGLIRKIKIDPREYPIIQWHWKIVNILKEGNVHRKDGDDYPARIYVVFEYDPEKLGFFEKAKYEIARVLYGEYPPLAALNYIWTTNEPVGSIIPNPYSGRAMMVVVESGETKLNEWINEERNLYEDYRIAFNDEPPMISGVAIMTDTDNTGESAMAFYGDILFRKAAYTLSTP